MAFALTLIGLLMIVTGIKGTHKQFGQLLISDFTGEANFTYWLASLGIIGLIGYYAPARGISRAFLILVVVAIVIRNGGFADNFVSALKAGPQPASGGTTAATQAPSWLNPTLLSSLPKAS